MTVSCPDCKALPGEPCQTLGLGHTRGDNHHAARLKLQAKTDRRLAKERLLAPQLTLFHNKY